MADDRVELMVSLLERALGASYALSGDLDIAKPATATPRSPAREDAMFVQFHKAASRQPITNVGAKGD